MLKAKETQTLEKNNLHFLKDRFKILSNNDIECGLRSLKGKV